MEVHIYNSIKAIVATAIVKDIVTTQKAKVERKSARDIKNLRILPKKFSRRPQAQERALHGYVSIYENTPKKLPHLPSRSWNNFSWWFKKGHNWGIVRVTQLRLVLRLHANTSCPDVYWRKRPNWRGPIWNYATGTLTFWKGC